MAADDRDHDAGFSCWRGTTVTIRSAKTRRGEIGKSWTFDVGPDFMAMLVERDAKTRSDPSMAARYGDHKFVFPYMDQHAQVVDEILDIAGIQKLRDLGNGVEERVVAHSLRHNFGVQQTEAGVHPFIIQNRMRHTDQKMTACYAEKAGVAEVVDVSALLWQNSMAEKETTPGEEAVSAVE